MVYAAQMNPLNLQYSKTQKRRALQCLWNELDRVLLPSLSHGVVLAISGGPDSRALLESIARWKHRFAGVIYVVTVDHDTRAQSSHEALAVYGRARALGFSAEICSLSPTSQAGEGALRERRYSALWRIAKAQKLGAICTAHHMDDEAESFLLDLVGKGGGKEGASMGSVIAFSEGKILRPFLQLSKMQLLAVLYSLGVEDYFQDTQDKQAISARAQIRHHLLPSLTRFHPDITKRLAVRADRARTQHHVLLDKAHGLLRQNSNGFEIAMAEVKNTELLRYALIEAFTSLACKEDLRSSAKTIEKIIKMAFLEQRHADKSFMLLGVQVLLTKSSIFLSIEHQITQGKSK